MITESAYSKSKSRGIFGFTVMTKSMVQLSIYRNSKPKYHTKWKPIISLITSIHFLTFFYTLKLHLLNLISILLPKLLDFPTFTNISNMVSDVVSNLGSNYENINHAAYVIWYVINLITINGLISLKLEKQSAKIKIQRPLLFRHIFINDKNIWC